MENSKFHQVTRELEKFILEDLSRWYVKSVRPRVKRGDEAATWTLMKTVKKTNLLLAPLAPYTSEKVYQELGGEKESVHMEEYPITEESFLDKKLEESMEIAREIVEKAIKIRDEKQYSLRWPAKEIIISADDEVKYALQEMQHIIKEMANVESFKFGEVSTSLKAEPDYSSIGPKFGKKAEKVADMVRKLDHDNLEQLTDTGTIRIEGFEIGEEDVKITKKTSKNVKGKEFEGGRIFLDLNMTEKIKDMAFVSEVIRAIQQKRKEEDLDVSDRVDLSFDGDFNPLKSNEETLRERINLNDIDYGKDHYKYGGEVEFKGRNISFSFSEPV